MRKEHLDKAESIELSNWQVRCFLHNIKSLYTIPMNIEKKGKPKKNFLGHWVWPKGEQGYKDEGIPKPYNEGDIVYGRETIIDKDGIVTYQADGATPKLRLCPFMENEEDIKWDMKNSKLTPGFMPKKFARLFFRVKSCFIPMRLHDVLKDYPDRMGVIRDRDGNSPTYKFDTEVDPEFDIMEAFKKVWDRGELSDNPWVWTLSLERL